MATAFWKNDSRKPGRRMLVVKFKNALGLRVEQRRPNDRTKSQALEYAREQERLAKQQRDGLLQAPAPAVAFGDLWDSWWKLDGSRRRAKSNAAIPGFMEKHLAALRPFVLTPGTAGAFAAQLQQLLAKLEDAEALGPASLNHLRGNVSRIFEHARDPKVKLWTGENPIEWVTVRHVPKAFKETLKRHEVKAVLDSLPSPVLGAPWRWAAAVCLYTGSRPGEAFGLRRGDVDLDAGVLIIRFSWTTPFPKNTKPRPVVIVPELKQYLNQALKASPNDLLLPRADGSPFEDEIRHGLVDHLRRAMVKAGFILGFQHTCRRCKGRAARLETKAAEFTWAHPTGDQRECPNCGMKLWAKAIPRPLRFYDLRHTHGTLLIRGGAGLGTAQKALGHSDPKITASTYDHTDLEDRRAEIERAMVFEGPDRLAPRGANRSVLAEVVVAPVVRGAPGESDGPAVPQTSLEGPRASTVGETGFEPATPWSRRQYPASAPNGTDSTGAHRVEKTPGYESASNAPGAQRARADTERGGTGGARPVEWRRRIRLLKLRFAYRRRQFTTASEQPVGFGCAGVALARGAR